MNDQSSKFSEVGYLIIKGYIIQIINSCNVGIAGRSKGALLPAIKLAIPPNRTTYFKQRRLQELILVCQQDVELKP